MSEETKKNEGCSICTGPARIVGLLVAAALILPLEIQGWMAVGDHCARSGAASVHAVAAGNAFASGDYQKALTGYVRAEAMRPTSSLEMDVIRARLYLAAHHPELIDARSTADIEYDIAIALQREPGAAGTYRAVKGHLLAIGGRREAAEKEYREVLTVDKSNVAASYGLALILQNSNPREAEELFAKVVEKAPMHLDAFIGLGAARLTNGNVEGAITALSQARDIKDDIRIHRLLGQAQVRKNQPTEAIIEFETAVRMNPQDFDSLVGLGTTYAATNDLAKAERALRAAAAIRGDENTLTNLTTVMLRQRKFSDVVQTINPAIQNRTAGPALLLNAARGWEGIGNLQNARLIYQEVQKLLSSGGADIEKSMAESILREASAGMQRVDQALAAKGGETPPAK